MSRRASSAALPGIVIDSGADYATVPSDRVVEAAMFLRDDEELDCKYLNTLLGIDWHGPLRRGLRHLVSGQEPQLSC